MITSWPISSLLEPPSLTITRGSARMLVEALVKIASKRRPKAFWRRFWVLKSRVGRVALNGPMLLVKESPAVPPAPGPTNWPLGAAPNASVKEASKATLPASEGSLSPLKAIPEPSTPLVAKLPDVPPRRAARVSPLLRVTVISVT